MEGAVDIWYGRYEFDRILGYPVFPSLNRFENREFTTMSVSVEDEIIPSIDVPDDRMYERVRAAFNECAKPPDSLGRLEHLAARYGQVHETVDLPPVHMRICTFAGDHGVVEEGVSAYPQQVTRKMVQLMEAGGAAINVLADVVDAEHRVVDVGVAREGLDGDGGESRDTGDTRASANMLDRPAMSPERTRDVIKRGVEEARTAVSQGATLLVSGDLGIGNTTVSAALISVLLDLSPERVVGRGSGANKDTLERKKAVIRTAIEQHRAREREPFDVLRHLGGPEMAGLTGFFLGAASERTPVIVDGLPTTAAAVVARELALAVDAYLFWSHRAGVRGHQVVLEALDKQPILDLDMRLGEGTGGALAGQLVDAAVRLYRNMAPLSDVLESGEGTR